MAKLEYVVQEGYHGIVIELRQEVIDFALEMESILKDNDHKTGWDNLSIHTLYNRIKQEFEELQAEYIVMTHNLKDESLFIQRMWRESIDIANFCMFLYHNYPKSDNSTIKPFNSTKI